MSTLSLSHTTARPASRGLVRIVSDVLANLAQEVALRRARATLGAMDDTLLTDIGVARGDIDHAVRHGRAGLRS